MNNWIFRRALLGFVTIVEEALSACRGMLPQYDDDPGSTPQRMAVTEAVYKVQVALKDLRELVEQLPADENPS